MIDPSVMPVKLPVGYIDMGTGSVIVQVLIATGVGMMYAFRGWIGNMFSKVKGMFKKHDKQL